MPFVHFQVQWSGLRPHGLIRLASAGAIAAFVACTDVDRTVAPAATATQDTTRVGLHRPLATDPGPLGSYTLTTPPDNVHATAWTSTGITIPPSVPIKVTISGTLTFTTNPAYLPCRGFDPGLPPWGSTLGPNGGTASPHDFRVHLSLTQNGNDVTNYSPSDQGADPVAGYFIVGGQFTLWTARPDTYGDICGTNPEWFISGSQTVSAEVLAPPVVTPDKNPAVPGDTVSFTVTVPWAASDTVTGGWQWIPDSAGAPNAAVVRGCGASSTCSYVIYGKGHAQVNGIIAQGMSLSATSPVIAIAVPTLKVTAAPTSVTPNGSVTFTASVTPTSASWSISSWTWTPDSGSGGISPNNCTAAEKTCTRTLSLSGWMKATAVIGTYTRTDSTHVSVVPCLTHVDGMDDSRIRAAVKNYVASSVANQLESQFFVYYDSSTNGYGFVDLPSDSASVCLASWHPPAPSGYPGRRPVAFFHVHPDHVGDIYYCPSDHRYEKAGGGFSKKDYSTYVTLQALPDYQTAGWTHFDFWVADEDFIYRLTPGAKLGSETRLNSTEFEWSGGTCKW